jgi:hypothetical protein
MSLIDTARDALKDLPISDIVRERLSLALDRLSDAEAKIEALQTEKGSLHAQLDRERLDHKQTQVELQRLRDEHSEEIRIHTGIEFRRGKRTGGVWIPFCPICHSPADLTSGVVGCANSKCKWQILYAANQVPEIILQL